ncbi:MAG: trimethylamine methyltransferase family protein [Pseudomonadota bacterium]
MATRKRKSSSQTKRQDSEAEKSVIAYSRGSSLHGIYQPLTETEVARIHSSALELLETVGMSGATPRVLEVALQSGCSVSKSGRLLFPAALVEHCIDRAAKRFIVHARDPALDFEATNDRVNFCTGGAAVRMLDPENRSYRPSTLTDLYDLARLCDTLENIQWFTRPVVINDVTDSFEFDVNTVYACAAGTKKHIATSITRGDHLFRMMPMLDTLSGQSAGFRSRPFCTVHATTVVSPMTFAPDSLDVACAATDLGVPIHLQTGPQSGATAPAALAGTLVQVCAETLASLTVINMLQPGHPVVLGMWVMVSDLRTGAFSGGGGEQALLGAAAGQMCRFYGVPGGMGAGMTDSKVPDNQAGFEKGLSVALAALSGCGFVLESAGMLGSLLGCSHAAMVIDNDMLSSIRRIGRGIDVSDESLSVNVIRNVVDGPGHFLGESQTMALMKSEYVYPRQSDRMSPEDWYESGAWDMWQRAEQYAQHVLQKHRPRHIGDNEDSLIRDGFPIHLTRSW